jgi:hypothetical protein
VRRPAGRPTRPVLRYPDLAGRRAIHCLNLAAGWATGGSEYGGLPLITAVYSLYVYKAGFFPSFLSFRFSFGDCLAFFCTSRLPLSFFPLSPISVPFLLRISLFYKYRQLIIPPGT